MTPDRINLLVERLEGILEHRWGAEYGVTIDYLAEHLGFIAIGGPRKSGHRACEKFLEDHLKDLRFTVCSLSRAGYFRPVRSSELNETISSLKRRAIKDFRRMQTVILKASGEQKFERFGNEFRDRTPTIQKEMAYVLT